MANEDRSLAGFADALAALGQHPSVLVIAALENGPLRLVELVAANPWLTDATVTASLRELDAEQYVVRRVDPGPPLRVLYELTERGASIAPALGTIAVWVRDRA